MLRRVTRLLLVTVAVIAGLTAAAWYASGGRLYSIQTGSMAPTIAIGDAVFTRRIDPQQLTVGDVVSFRDGSQPNVVFTHRVISLQAGSQQLTTQGDHNAQPDPPINADQVVGRVQWRAVGLGKVLNWLRRPLGLLLLVYIPALVVSFRLLMQLQQRPTYQLRR